MKTIGPYQVIETIGQGGMGTVYKVLRPSLQRIEALKMLSETCAKDKVLVERFTGEAPAMASLGDYRHVVQVFDLDCHEGRHFYTMEYIPKSLAQLIGDHDLDMDKTAWSKPMKKSLKASVAVKIVSDILEGLKVVHEAGIIHRDITPHNVMIAKNKNSFVAKLTDFGIAKVSDVRLTRTGFASMGKPFYCAPEQRELLSSATERSDLYSVGILMYRLLTGNLPVAGCKSPKAVNSDIEERLDQWTLTAFQYEPEDRFPDAGTMLEALKKAIAPKVAERKSIKPPSTKGTAKPRIKAKESTKIKNPLRSKPRKVLREDAKKVFGLDDGWRPKKYTANDYCDKGDGTVTDRATGLMWEQSGSGYWLHYEDGKKYILDLNRNKFAGHDDWRFPTVDELLSLMVRENRSNDFFAPSFHTIFDKKQAWCWSSDNKDSGGWWCVNFFHGSVDWYGLNNDSYVRGVREWSSKR